MAFDYVHIEDREINWNAFVFNLLPERGKPKESYQVIFIAQSEVTHVLAPGKEPANLESGRSDSYSVQGGVQFEH